MPLGVELAVGRWHRQTCVSPRQRVPLQPATSSHRDTRAVGAARGVRRGGPVRLRALRRRAIQPARFDNLEAVLAERRRPAPLRLPRRGRPRRAQVLLLEDADTLEPSRSARCLGSARRAGSTSRSSSSTPASPAARSWPLGASGFARSFIELDASGMSGRSGASTTRPRTRRDRVLPDLIDDPETPFAEVLRKIRARGSRAPAGQYAAYCFYGDPSAGLP